MKPLWDELRETADDLLSWNKVSKQQLQVIRAAATQMENWFIANAELREENEACIKRILEQDEALHALADVFFHAAKFARREITLDAFGTSIVDKAPFTNVMAAHGLDSIGAPVKRRINKRATA